MWSMKARINKNQQKSICEKGFIPISRALYSDILLQELWIKDKCSYKEILSILKNTKFEDKFIMPGDVVLLRKLLYNDEVQITMYRDQQKGYKGIFKLDICQVDIFAQTFLSHRGWSWDDVIERIVTLFMRK